MGAPTLAARIWSVFVIVAVLGTILIAPTWETVFAAALAVILNVIGPENWKVDFGLLRRVPWRTIIVAILAGIALFFFVKLFLQPACDRITHHVRDLHSFDRIRQHPGMAVMLIVKTMLAAGLCEEIIFRGTLLQRLRLLFGWSRWATVASVLLTTAIFSSFHWYQGPSGLLLTAILGLIDSLVYVCTGYRLIYSVILHLVYDTLALSAIAANYDLTLARWAEALFRHF
ncbi:MAG TPA: CPBP family intramembrane glutamic endopeptidase [Terriglobales bacterium]|jgi:membrane protease YdiL (CAAX protease family)|nr:CPBP family intramembrane glutamic endopeptidase [Terriglobales bacterium]